ncbi:iron-sulfur cluster biosynthesis family protein [Oceanobacillus damuensis]|uniref:iron-sulfur cluster biosynthesis family protein n=1 Tax=Oceanobacillus damuensis TaxID=937928 RepID=UPI00082D2F47|nr:iron-sulfur cluster biosynthesis family protein [Oceanobacillus damuensis]
MRLTITPEAEQQLGQMRRENDRYLLLWYDIDDCGCGVNGLPTIRFVREKKPNYSQMENDGIPTFIDSQQAVFFADEMILGVHKGVFRLSSKEGILNPFIPSQNLLQA